MSSLSSQVDIIIQPYLFVIRDICFLSLPAQMPGPENVFFLFGVKILSQRDMVFYFKFSFIVSKGYFPFVILIIIFVILLLLFWYVYTTVGVLQR